MPEGGNGRAIATTGVAVPILLAFLALAPAATSSEEGQSPDDLTPVTVESVTDLGLRLTAPSHAPLWVSQILLEEAWTFRLENSGGSAVLRPTATITVTAETVCDASGLQPGESTRCRLLAPGTITIDAQGDSKPGPATGRLELDL